MFLVVVLGKRRERRGAGTSEERMVVEDYSLAVKGNGLT